MHRAGLRQKPNMGFGMRRVFVWFVSNVGLQAPGLASLGCGWWVTDGVALKPFHMYRYFVLVSYASSECRLQVSDKVHAGRKPLLGSAGSEWHRLLAARCLGPVIIHHTS